MSGRTEMVEGARPETMTAAKAEELEPDRGELSVPFGSIATTRDAADVDHHLAVIDRGLVAARATGPTEEMLHSAAALHQLEPGPDWTQDARRR